jgi:Ca2+-binding RTX toxin-like protein
MTESVTQTGPKSAIAANAAANGRAGVAGQGDVIAKPEAGEVKVVDAASNQRLEFGFSLAGVKIAALDVDVVLIFPDNSKIIIPGLALRLASVDAPELSFHDEAASADKILSLIGEVKLTDSLMDLSLTSVQTSQPAKAQGNAEGNADGQAEGEGADVPKPPVVQTVAQPAMVSQKTSDFTSDESSSNRADSIAEPMYKIQSAAGGSKPEKPVDPIVPVEPIVEPGTGNVIAAKLTLKLLGVVGFAREDLGSHIRIKGEGGAPGSDTDASYAAQMKAETIDGTSQADEIFADDPTMMPPGTFTRLIDVTASMQDTAWTPVQARIVGLPPGFSIVNGKQVGNDYLIDLPATDSKHFQLKLRYVIPPDGTQADANGFLSTFNLTIQFSSAAGKDARTLASGSVPFAIREVLTESDATFGDPDKGTSVYILPSNPTGNNVKGGAGDDTIHAGAGADTLDGGDGVNTLSYGQSSSGVAIDIESMSASGGFAKRDNISNFQNLIGSDLNDTLKGDGRDNLIRGGSGADSMVGGEGKDTIDYSTSKIGVVLDLQTGIGRGGEAEGDRFAGFEYVQGSSSDDKIDGTTADETIHGGEGNDTVAGNGGADSLVGGEGSNDLLDFSRSSVDMSIDLAQGQVVASDGKITRVMQFEGIIASDIANDTIFGDSGNNRLTGGGGNNLIDGREGNDLIDGGSGNDTLVGGLGSDTLIGGSGIDLVDYSNADSVAGVAVDLLARTAGGGAEGDSIVGIEQVLGTRGADSMRGGVASATLMGGAGNDTLMSGSAADSLVGGDGVDLVSYERATDGVSVDLGAGRGFTGDATDDRYSGVERLSGSNLEDTLIGGDADETIQGLKGFDSLSGGAGNDSLLGGDGADTLVDQSGFNTLDGGDGDDSLLGGAGSRLLGQTGNDTLAGSGATLIGGTGNDVYVVNDGTTAVIETDGLGQGVDEIRTDLGSFSLAALADIENLAYTGAGAFTGTGNAADNRIIGGRLNDSLSGGAGNDLLNGGSGDDILSGGIGADILIGGDGIDRVDYSDADSLQGVFVDLSRGLTGRAAQGDSLSGIERIDGSAGADCLVGGDGESTLVGNGGNDTLVSKGGVDSLDGGDGVDLVSYESSALAVSVDLQLGQGLAGEAAGDRYSGIERVLGSNLADMLTGSTANETLDGGNDGDSLTGGGGSDSLLGNQGNDTLIDMSGADTLDGGAGDDSLIGGTGSLLLGQGGNDTLSGSGGAITLTGGAGNDVYILNDTVTTIVETGGTVGGVDEIRTDLGSFSLAAIADIERLTYTGTGSFVGEGNAGNNIITGGDLNDSLSGGAGNDLLDGGIGDDTLNGGVGADILIGGDGIDRVDYSDADSLQGVFVDLSRGLTGRAAQGDSLSGIERIDGSAGADCLVGGDGESTLVGNGGNDTLVSKAGADSLDGGDGVDLVSYESSTLAVSIDLQLGQGSAGEAAGDRYSGIERVLGSNLDDTLSGSTANETLDGGNDADSLTGGGGSDSLLGNQGNDTIIDASGADTLDGGAGDDSLIGGTGSLLLGQGGNDTLSGSGGAITLTGGAGNDVYILNDTVTTIVETGGTVGGVDEIRTDLGSFSLAAIADIERLTYTGVGSFVGEGNAGNNIITGGDLNDSLSGGAGNDLLDGGIGDDTLNGGVGADTLIGGDGIDRVDYSDADSLQGVFVDLSRGLTGRAAQGDSLSGIERIDGSAGSDCLVGGDGESTLVGNGGNDTLVSKGGADSLDGGDGVDLVSYESSTLAVSVDLQLGQGSAGEAAGDRYSGIERVLGSNLDDTLSGSTANETLDGGNDADSLTGGGGSDSLLGNQGNDTLIDASGSDTLDGGAGDDSLIGGTGSQLLGQGGNDTLSGSGGAITLTGGAGNDVYMVNDTVTTIVETGGGVDEIRTDLGSFSLAAIADIERLTYAGAGSFVGVGNAGNNIITGGDLNDSLSGGAGNDLLDGGQGDDTFDGGLGADTFQGGGGTDVVTYAAAAAGIVLDPLTGTSSGEAAGDQFIGIERIIGSNFDDRFVNIGSSPMTISGGMGNDSLTAGSGGDTLDGGANDDLILAGASADSLIGGDGNDTLSYASAIGGGVNVDLGAGVGLSGFADGDRFSGFESLIGSGGSDTLIGSANVDSIDGGDNADSLSGGAGNDYLAGAQGDDTIDGGAGADTLLGGLGLGDMLSYASATGDIVVNLQAQTISGGDAAGDSISGFEGVTGGSGNDLLTGRLGQLDTLIGGAGNDTLIGNGGADSLIGGIGADRYEVSGGGETIVEDGTDASIDTVVSSASYGLSAHLEALILTGTANLAGTGNTLANSITGNTGANLLMGDDGADTLEGGAGNDTLVGGADNDSLIGGTGNDVYIVDSTDDRVVELTTDSGTDEVRTTLTTYSLNMGDQDGVENLTFIGTSGASGVGNALANIITGTTDADSLDGDQGADTLIGQDGADWLRGGADDDSLSGGADIDTADYATATSGVAVNLFTNRATGGAGNDTLSSIEIVSGSQFNDTLTASKNADSTLIGNDGDDTFILFGQADSVDGGTGTDAVDFSGVTGTTGINIDLTNGRLTSIERIIGTSRDDTIVGTTGSDTIAANDGNDCLAGGMGADSLDAGAGNDIVILLDADTIAGGAGNDIADFSASTENLTIDLGAADQLVVSTVGGSMSGFEGAISGSGHDSLVGTTNADTLLGGAGNDTLRSNGGADSLRGGDGSDYYFIDSGSAVFLEDSTAASGRDTVETSANYTLTSNVEELILVGVAQTGTGNELDNAILGRNGGVNYALFGAAGNDTLTGNLGNDTLDGGTGNDSLVGGDGNDVYLIDSAQDVLSETGGTADEIRVAAGGPTTLSLASAGYAGVENLIYLGTGNFTGTGDSVDNRLTGSSGHDSLIGAAGADTLDGGSGNDTLDGGAGTDSLVGGSGDDVYLLRSANSDLADTISDAGGADEIRSLGYTTFSLAAYGAIENLTMLDSVGSASSADLTATGNSLANRITTGSGNDILAGDTGAGGVADTLTGGAGNDLYRVYVAGSQVVEDSIGGAGVDTIETTLGAYTLGANVEVLKFIGAGNFSGEGNSSANTLIGGSGADTLTGGEGNDCLVGGAGNDLYILNAQDSSDTISEASGNDTVWTRGLASYSLAANVEHLTMLASDGTGLTTAVSATGNNLANSISTGSGNDTLSDDTATGGGADTLIGGAGNDLYRVYAAGTQIIEDSGAGNDTVQAYANSYTLAANIEALQFLGTGDFSGVGNDGANTLTGGTGNDTLDGAIGNDSLVGGAGNDTLRGGTGNDTLDGGAGDDVYIFDSGDSINEGVNSGTDEIRTSLTSLSLASYADVENLTFIGVGDASLTGNGLDNRLTGGTGADSLSGATGNDTLIGATGDDSLSGGTGADTLDGGSGHDTLDGGSGNDSLVGGDGNDVYLIDSAQDVLSETGGTADEIRVAAGGPTTLSLASAAYASIENLIYLGVGDFSGTGNESANILTGGSGHDSLAGAGGDDTLTGGAGNDTLTGGTGTDSLIGGSGNDVYILDFSDDIVEQFNEGTDEIRTSLTNASLAANVENLTFTGVGDAVLTGNELNNILTGLAGNDSLSGLAGHDTLNSGAGDDTLAGGAGNDSLDGGEGNDTLDGGTGNDTLFGGDGNDVYVIDSAQDVLSETGGTADEIRVAAGGPTTLSLASADYAGIENLTYLGTGDFSGTGNSVDNRLTGSSGHDSLIGAGGADTLDGAAGNDTLDGGAGTDSLVGGLGDDLYLLRSANSDLADIISDAGGTDEIRSLGFTTFNLGGAYSAIENLTMLDSAGLASTADLIATGNSLANRITTGSGNDILAGDTGAGGLADTLTGGAGNDLYRVYVSGSQVVEDSIGGAGVDTIETTLGAYTLGANVEVLKFVGAGNFSGTGNSSANTLIGGSGADTLTGGAGTDSLTGGAGNDLYILDGAQDSLDAISENAGEGSDTVWTQGLAGYTLAANVDHLLMLGAGGAALTTAVSATGNNLANSITTGSGADTLSDDTALGGGADTLTGGAGNDLYRVYGAGTQVMETSGAGNDTVQAYVNSYVLAADIEALQFLGTGDFSGVGNSGVNTLTGGTGNDTLDGGIGADSLDGGAGDDVYIFDSGDSINEGVSSGTDEIRTSLTSLSLASYANVEHLTFTGAGAASLTGNGLDNRLTGGTGGDSLSGATGADTLDGGSGNDTLDGGSGNDSLSGGGGNDVYVIDSAGDILSDSGGTADEIRVAAGGPTVLSLASAAYANFENLTYLGTGDFSGTGNESANILTGGSGHDSLAGAGGDDTLTGGAGNDTLTGGTGADSLIGGAGNDVYILDFSDGIVEQFDEGTDEIRTSLTNASLAANVENLTFTGVGDAVLTGNELNNILTGLAGNDALSGLDGHDTLNSGAGDDTLAGGAGNDSLAGGDGNDTLDGGTGNDTLFGGDGNDVYLIDSAQDVLSETGGTADEIRVAAGGPTTLSLASAAYTGVENLIYLGTGNFTGTGDGVDNRLTGSSGHDSLTGAAGADTLDGGAGNDTLDGGAGTDNLSGGLGDDLYLLRSANSDLVDTISDAGGTDEIRSLGFTTFNLGGAYSAIENLTMLDSVGATSLADLTATGNSLANRITTGSGNDILAGDTGAGGLADTLTGGAGNDLYRVYVAGTSVVEVAAAGTDTIETTLNAYTLGSDIEALQFIGSGNFSGEGNSSANTLIGGSGADTLTGWAGTDSLAGGAGNDFYILNGAQDSLDAILENSAEGNDTVHAWGLSSHVLAANVDHLVMLGAGGAALTTAVSATGNSLANSITTGTGNDTLSDSTALGGGSDTLTGGAGDDVYRVYAAGTQIVESSVPGSGNDSVEVYANSFTLAANIEALRFLGTGGFVGTGNALANTINASAATGDSSLVGDLALSNLLVNGDAEAVVGGYGQTRAVDNGTAGLGWESDGTQVFVANNGSAMNGSFNFWNQTPNTRISQSVNLDSQTYTLYFESSSAAQIYIQGSQITTGISNSGQLYSYTFTASAGLTTIGLSNNNGYLDNIGLYSGSLSGYFADALIGGAGNDTLNGGIGRDTMTGGAGNDVYIVDSSDVIVESSVTGSGIDEIRTSRVSTDLTAFANVENLTYTGAVSALLAGSALNNRLVGATGNDSITGAAGNDTLDGASGADTLDGGADNDSLTGAAGNDSLVGGAGNDILDSGADDDTLDGGTGIDSLSGGAGNDLLFGGADADTLAGGAGNDIYRISGSGAVVVEASGGGNDTVEASVNSYTLTAEVESLRFIGTGNFTGVGNALSNLIDVTSVPGGSDSLVGDSGVVNLLVNGDGEALIGAGVSGYDQSTANISSGTGGWTSSAVNGMYVMTTSAASISGGAAFQIQNYTLSQAIVTANGQLYTLIFDALNAAPIVKLYNAASNTETELSLTRSGSLYYATFTAGAGTTTEFRFSAAAGAILQLDNIGVYAGNVINAFNDTLLGWAGNDTLDGSLGRDSLVGGLGDDVYIVDNFNDVILENASEGTDEIRTTFSRINLANYANIENAAYLGLGNAQLLGTTVDNRLTGNIGNDSINGGDGNDTLIGGAGVDTLAGGNGNDWLDARTGADTLTDFLYGGTGDDVYVVTAQSFVSESGGSGNDTVYADNDIDLTNTVSGSTRFEQLGGVSAIETVIYSKTGATARNWTAKGDNAANWLIGGAGNDTLDGGAGNDCLFGGDGHDSLVGGAGNDTLFGSAGNDTLDGGTGSNWVDYSAALGSVIVDLSTARVDKAANFGAGSTSRLLDFESPLDNAQITLAGTQTGGGVQTVGGNSVLNFANTGLTSANQFYGDLGPVTLGPSFTLMANVKFDQFGTWQRIFEMFDSVYSNGISVRKVSNTNNLQFNVSGYVGVEVSNVLTTSKWTNIAVTLEGRLASVYIDGVLVGSNTSAFDIPTLTRSINWIGRSGWPDSPFYGQMDNIVVLDRALTASAIATLSRAANLSAGAGTDSLSGIDNAAGSAGDDSLLGNDNANILQGNGGQDTLSGAIGNDSLAGGGGNDSLLGGANNDTLDGGAGNDTLDGGTGTDSLIGGAGNDWYIVSSTTVTLTDSGGTDEVRTTLTSYRMAGISAIERITYTGTDAFSGYGNAAHNVMTGGIGADTLVGAGGNDTLIGGAGADLLSGDTQNTVAGVYLSDIQMLSFRNAYTNWAYADFDQATYPTYDRAIGMHPLNTSEGPPMTMTFSIGDATYFRTSFAVTNGTSTGVGFRVLLDGVQIFGGSDTVPGSPLNWRMSNGVGSTGDLSIAGGKLLTLVVTPGPDNSNGADQAVWLNPLLWGGSNYGPAANGADWLDGGAGNDTLFGGVGNDSFDRRGGRRFADRRGGR